MRAPLTPEQRAEAAELLRKRIARKAAKRRSELLDIHDLMTSTNGRSGQPARF